MVDLPDANVLFAFTNTDHLTHPVALVADLHLLALAATHGGRLTTFDSKIAAALRPIDRKYVNVLAKWAELPSERAYLCHLNLAMMLVMR